MKKHRCIDFEGNFSRPFLTFNGVKREYKRNISPGCFKDVNNRFGNAWVGIITYDSSDFDYEAGLDEISCEQSRYTCN